MPRSLARSVLGSILVRRRWSADEARQVLDMLDSSGLSAGEFAARTGVEAQGPSVHVLREAPRANPGGLLGPQRLRHLDEAFGERPIPSELFRRRPTHLDAGGGRGARVDRGGDRSGRRATPASLAAPVDTRK